MTERLFRARIDTIILLRDALKLVGAIMRVAKGTVALAWSLMLCPLHPLANLQAPQLACNLEPCRNKLLEWVRENLASKALATMLDTLDAVISEDTAWCVGNPAWAML